MTLLEMVFAFAIATMAIIWTISGLFSAIAANRIMTANIAANAAILQQREEVMIIAHDGGKATKADLVANVLEYYDEMLALGDKLDIGPYGTQVPRIKIDEDNRGLVYTFPIPRPGEAVDENNLYNMGYGEMVIYLREGAVPGNDTIATLYEDLPYNTKTGVTHTDGYDLNGDGTVADFTFTQGGRLRKILRTPPQAGTVDNGTGGMWIQSLPIDINIIYFTGEDHNRLYFTNTRRIMITGVSGAAETSGE